KSYDIRGIVPDELDERVAEAVGAAFVRLTGASCVATAHDMRTSSPALAEAFGRGAIAQGAEVIAAGLGSTHLLHYATARLDVPGAVSWRSPSPPSCTGIKLCRGGARPVAAVSGLNELREMAVQGVPARDGPHGTVAPRDLLPDYAAHLKSLVDLSGIRPLTVAVDAGDGVAGYTGPTVFEGLPLTLVPLYFARAGPFPH